MSRPVKCAVTGEKGTNDTFYKAPNGRYYKDVNVYNEFIKEKETRNLIIKIINEEYLHYNKGQVYNTLVPYELKRLSFYKNKVILETIKKCHNNIIWAMENKSFDKDSSKVKYIFAIIRNNINDIYKEEVKKEKAKTVVKRTTSKIDINQMVEEIESDNTNSGKIKKHTKDVSRLIDDDLL